MSRRSFFIPVLFRDLKRYSWKCFKKDCIAGITVAVVALPLAMGFAIASGVRPEQGIYTAIVAGFLASLLGGSHYLISGPTAAFVVIIYDIIQRHGYDGLVVCTLFAAVGLILAGFLRLGKVMQFVPHPLVTGFTAGIAAMIFFGQIKELFGLRIAKMPAGLLSQVIVYFEEIGTFDLVTSALGLGTIALILAFQRFLPKLPWGIFAIGLATAVCMIGEIPVRTVGSQFGEFPSMLPAPSFGHFSEALSRWHDLLPDAAVIAFLIGIESLLSATVADGMTGQKHNSDSELVAQGIANFASVAFLGLPASGAISRTTVNVRTGAKTPLSGVIHALFLFLIILLFAPLVGKIPLMAISAVLIVIAWNMSEIGHVQKLLRAPRGDRLILLVTFFLTILVDLTIAVGAGMVLAAFSFLKQMAEFPLHFVTKEGENGEELPEDVEVYDLHGPLFFGVAGRLQEVLSRPGPLPKACILRLKEVTLVDASGVHALTELLHRCERIQVPLLLSEASEKPKDVLEKTGFLELLGKEKLFSEFQDALSYAERI